jgi:thioredoxin-dependent peroxiredoxin
VFGASFDTTDENRAFRDAQGFTYPLLSDVDKTVGTAYEVVRSPDHKYANFPERHSYLIDPHGVIAAVYDVTDVAQHAADVLRTLREKL